MDPLTPGTSAQIRSPEFGEPPGGLLEEVEEEQEEVQEVEEQEEQEEALRAGD